MKYVKFFNNLGKNDALIAGGKGASLGEMTNAKIPVPPGFVILSSGFEYFLSQNDLTQEIEAILNRINHKEMEGVERASENIKKMILEAKLPTDLVSEIKVSIKKLNTKFVAVRSSATAEDGALHAWAGQLDSFLNTTSKDLEENIKKCFSSLFTPRAIFYRFEKGLHDSHISVAVVVQKMVNSEKSGVAFSVHPVTEDRNQMIIEASWGLGEAIVSGQVTPDSYVIEKDSKNIIDTNIAEKSKGLFRKLSGGNAWENVPNKKTNEQCLSNKEILKFSDLLLKIEKHYGFPCDIEWAYEKGKFYITQSRPITTLKKNEAEVKYFPDGVIKMGHWALPPLASECWNSEITQEKFLKKFGMYREFIVIHQINPLYQNPFYSKVFFSKLDKQIEKLYKSSPGKIGNEIMKFYSEVEAAKKAISKLPHEDLNKLSDSKLAEVFTKNRKLTAEITVYDQFGWLAENTLTNILHGILVSKKTVPASTEFNDFLFTLTKPKHISTTLKEKLAVLEQALKFMSGATSLDLASIELASTFGFMPVFSYGTPWNKDHYKIELERLAKLSKEDIVRKIQELKDYTKIQSRDFSKAVKNLRLSKSEAQKFIDFGSTLDARNEAEYFVSFSGLHLTKILPEISKRLTMKIEDLQLLTTREIVDSLNGKSIAKNILSDRKTFVGWGFLGGKERRMFSSNEAGEIFRDFEARKSLIQGNNESDGKCGSPGMAKGKARICKSPSEIEKVKDGDVLITYATTVDYLPAMKLASAIVTEVGGITCHAAVVSREFGIPCVIGLKGAMTKFKDGDVVEVDADKGVVKIINK